MKKSRGESLLTMLSNSDLCTALSSTCNTNCWTSVRGFRSFSGSGMGSLWQDYKRLFYTPRSQKRTYSYGKWLHVLLTLSVQVELWRFSSEPLPSPFSAVLPSAFAALVHVSPNSLVESLLVLYRASVQVSVASEQGFVLDGMNQEWCQLKMFRVKFSHTIG
jgi:hypothetical protein